MTITRNYVNTTSCDTSSSLDVEKGLPEKISSELKDEKQLQFHFQFEIVFMRTEKGNVCLDCLNVVKGNKMFPS